MTKCNYCTYYCSVALRISIDRFIKPGFRLGKTTAVTLGIGILTIACFLVMFLPGLSSIEVSRDVALALENFYKLTSVLLLLLWLEQLSSFTLKEFAFIVSVGCVLLAVVEALELSLQTGFAQAVFAFAPAASTAALLYASRAQKTLSTQASDTEPRFRNASASVQSIVALCLGVFIFTLIGSSIQLHTKINSTIGQDVIMGWSDVIGLVVVAVVFIMLVTSQRRFMPTLIALFAMPVILTLAYMLSISLPAELYYMICLPLAIARRMTLVFWFIAALCFTQKTMAAMALLLTIYRFSQVAGFSALVQNIVDQSSTMYSLLAISAITFTVILCPLIAFLCFRGPTMRKDQPTEKPGISQSAALDAVAATYGLTTREREVLTLIAQGWRAASIAEKLVVSQATVKNHMNNIYSKLGAHSQDDVMRIVEEAQRLG